MIVLVIYSCVQHYVCSSRFSTFRLALIIPALPEFPLAILADSYPSVSLPTAFETDFNGRTSCLIWTRSLSAIELPWSPFLYPLREKDYVGQ